MEAIPLPPHPNLEHYKKRAKDLLNACTSPEPGAIRTLAAQWFEDYAEQEVEIQARLRGVAASSQLRQSLQSKELDRIEKNIQASKLKNPDRKLADAQFFIARAHGFESWPKFARQVQALQRGNSQSARFEAAADSIIAGDIQTLERLLHEDSRLISARSQRIHAGTLLHYVAANGVEMFRQKTPRNIVKIAQVLLDAGVDVDAESNAYGGGCTALGLVATSIHPERAGVQDALLQLLLDRGAAIDKCGIGGNRQTAVEACLANGRGSAAKFLASRGARLTLQTAAGAGVLEVVETFFREEGSGLDPAVKEQLQRGFVWACMYGHDNVVEFLLQHGAAVREQGGLGATGLHWAAGGGHLGIIQLLLNRGAPLEEINKWGGTVLEHAGWAFANGNPDIDFVPIFERLLAAGAKVRDGWLTWLDKLEDTPAARKARIAEVLRRYGAVT